MRLAEAVFFLDVCHLILKPPALIYERSRDQLHTASQAAPSLHCSVRCLGASAIVVSVEMQRSSLKH